MTKWSATDAYRIYNIDHWGDGYFGVSDQGRVTVTPHPGQPQQTIELAELVRQARQAGLSLPLLVRFTDILHDRVNRLCQAFRDAMAEAQYSGGYTAIYPIKVNQQRRVVEEILRSQTAHPDTAGQVGLEAGSKPELMAVLAMSEFADATIVCNGYKDREYIQLALLGEKLGHRVYIVVEKMSELDLVLEEARALQVRPRIGVRARLASIGKGNWQNTGGEKSKFGLTAAQILQLVARLRAEEALDWLQLLHFHLGSQIANIRDIQRGLRECGRFYAELCQLGARIQCVDVGGGLGVDYEGTRSRSVCSINYSMREYANNVVHAFKEVCERHDLPHPRVISESGRAMTAHHAVLITDVIGRECAEEGTPQAPAATQPAVLQELWRSYRELQERADERTVVEHYHDVVQAMSEAQDMYVHGILGLAERAQAEQLYTAACVRIRNLLNTRNRAHRDILDELNEKLADKLFVNFSLFQSLPDVWGIDQIFPILPLEHLDREPTRRGVIQDITCDSDGRIDLYVDGQGLETTLPLPDWEAGQPYLLGFFMVGAYQEILGDMHNLFGDTDSVDVSVNADGSFKLSDIIKGDTVASVLRYVNFEPRQLLASYRRQLDASELSDADKQAFMALLDEGMKGYTYLE